jgi:membrane protease YdiL (CAAX protease family)
MNKEQKTVESHLAPAQGGQTSSSMVETSPERGPAVRASVPWSPWVAVLYAVLVYFAAQLIGELLVYLYPVFHGWSVRRADAWLSSSVLAQFWFVLFSEALTFGAIWWFIRRRKSTLQAIGWKRLRWTDPVMTLTGFAVYFVGYITVLTVVTHLLPGLNVNQKQELGFDNIAGNTNLLLTFLSLVVLPPIAEETVFRGFVYTGIRNKIKPISAALLTSLLFAVAHLQFGSGRPLLWVAGLDTFILSLVLCYLREKTGSLWPGVLLHGLKNSIAFISLYLLHVH